MDKLLDWLTLKPLKGSRTAISMLVAGVLALLNQFGLLSDTLQAQIIEVGKYFALYFAIEHWKPGPNA